MDEIKKILIYRTDRYGDFLISAPFIKSLKSKYPRHQIHVVCSSYNEKLAKDFSFIDKIFTLKDGFLHRLIMLFTFFFKKYEFIIILDGKRRSFFLSLFIRGKIFFLIKNNNFLINLSNFFKISYVINSEVQSQIKNFEQLANILNFRINKWNIYSNYKFKKLNIKLPNNFLIFHLDEKWYKDKYYKDWTDINPSAKNIVEIFIYIIQNSKIKNIVLTTGFVKLDIIDDLLILIKKNNFLSKKVIVLDNISFLDLQYVIKKSSALICCEGGISHVAFFFNKKTLALVEDNKIFFYKFWTGHMKKILLHKRENINLLFKKNSVFLSKINHLLA